MSRKQIIKVAKKIFCLQPIPTLLISIPSYALVIYSLTGKDVNPVISYLSYLFSAYALIITVTGITGIVHLMRHGIEQNPFIRRMRESPLVDRYLREDVFRAEAALYQGLAASIFYACIKMFSGILYRSVWFITLAVYYILLALMRVSLLHYMRYDKKNKVFDWAEYRLCGIILLFMNFVLTGIIVLVVYQNSGFVYPGVLIYIMAMYAFYAVFTAARNVIKFRRYGSPALSACKVISLTVALVSMLSLETAMLTQFGTTNDAGFRQIMTACTGAGISIIVLGMAVFMIVHSTKQLKQLKQEKET